MELEVEIIRLGAQGDGVAEGPERPIFVPFTLPGERVRVELDEGGSGHAGLLEVLEPSPDRVAPICPHFGSCGGCALQHMESHVYLRWKRAQVVAALRSRGLDAEIEEVRPVPLGSRRRASLALGRFAGRLALGYRRARSHDLIDVATCPVLSPPIVASLPKLKGALAPLLGGNGEAKITVTETGAGLDIVAEGLRPTAATLGAFAGQAAALGVARLTVDGESIAVGATPTVTLGDVAVRLPPGAFLQASREAEGVLVGLVRESVGGAKRIADMFAGLGTFTLALAGKAAVDAFEADEAALAALAEAARRTPKLKPVRTFIRDLFRSPLGAKELQGYDAVVFDPPRAGASAQAAELAKSRVPKLVAVSCNPGTLARDLRLLVDGGYRIARIVPVDQFLFSPHIEVVAHLTR
ncbi:MAG: class I SAM-dependent RNA methyltransferase [Methyloceanibacter sp.]|nr:class I SAM-dependent RNA methyltransferase [Methyloceanibacter sp.]